MWTSPAKDRKSRPPGTSSETRLTPTSTWTRSASLAVAFLGLSVWAQLGGPELFADGQSPWVVFTAFLPLIVGGFALVMRSGVGALLLFLVATLPALAAMPATAHAVLLTPFGMFRTALSLALYLAAAGAWLSGTQPVAAREPVGDASTRIGGEYKWFVASRGVALLTILCVLVWAVYFDGLIVSTIAANHPDGERVAQTFIALVAFFVWTAIAYTMFLVPLLNLEYDRRKVERTVADAIRTTRPSRSFKRLGIEATAVAFFVGLLLIV